MRRKNYRKIYEQYHGPIPTDEDGRKYDIHHIDGNHENNDPMNLKAISVREHYDIHYQQQDYAACLLIKKQRMILTKEERSELSRRLAIQRAQQGTHPAQLMVKNGTHPFLGGQVQIESNKKRLENGTHNFLTNNPTLAKMKDGTHNFKVNNPAQIKKICEHCSKEIGLNMYKRWHGSKCKNKAEK